MRRCPDARGGLRWYRGRYAAWRSLRGLSTPYPVGRKPRNCADAKYLASVWVGRSFKQRRATERWQSSIGQVIRRLERAMSGTPMAGTGADLERVAREHHVSPYFIVAVAATESSIGEAACGYLGHNAWGLGNCGSAWSVPSFASWEEAYVYYARFLNRQWPGHSSPYSFRGYAKCDECWARKVSSWMSSLFGVSTRTTYP